LESKDNKSIATLHVWKSGNTKEPQDYVIMFSDISNAYDLEKLLNRKGYKTYLLREIEELYMQCPSCKAHLRDEEFFYSSNNQCPRCNGNLLGVNEDDPFEKVVDINKKKRQTITDVVL